MNKKNLFIIYAWLSAIAWMLIITWFSSLDKLSTTETDSTLLEDISYFLSFGILTILIFRAFIATFRLTVERLSNYRGRREAKEDAEFVIIIETLLLSNSILLSLLIMFGNLYILSEGIRRGVDTYDIFTNTLAILLFALISYSWPLLSNFEINLASRIQKALT